jgi:hypothetical protein
MDTLLISRRLVLNYGIFDYSDIEILSQLQKSYIWDANRKACRSLRKVSGARFDIVTALLMKINSFWNVTPCRLVNSYRRFRGQSSFILGVKHGHQNCNVCISGLIKIHSASFELLNKEGNNSLFANFRSQSTVKEVYNYIYDVYSCKCPSVALQFGGWTFRSP